jgi:hypothetical protein
LAVVGRAGLVLVELVAQVEAVQAGLEQAQV